MSLTAKNLKKLSLCVYSKQSPTVDHAFSALVWSCVDFYLNIYTIAKWSLDNDNYTIIQLKKFFFFFFFIAKFGKTAVTNSLVEFHFFDASPSRMKASEAVLVGNLHFDSIFERVGIDR